MNKKLIHFIVGIFSIIMIPNIVFADTQLDIIGLNLPVYGDSTILKSQDEVLLMDTGYKNDRLISLLKEQGIKQLSIYVSHYHADHLEEVKEIINSNEFTIRKIYLPDTGYLTKYSSSENSPNEDFDTILNSYIKNQHNPIVNAAKEKGIEVQYLKAGSTFTIGDATAEVIGPVDGFKTFEFDWWPENVRTDHYNNNNSLVTKIKVGNTTFLTAGDIESCKQLCSLGDETLSSSCILDENNNNICDTGEEEKLINSNIDLSADIMKLSHHGTYTSNSIEFIKKVNPKYVFYMFSGEKEENNNVLFGEHEKDYLKNIRTLNNLTNIYSTKYNGTVTFKIRNDEITVETLDNYNQITIHYLDVDTNKEIDQKVYNFNNATNYILYDYQKEINDYKYEKDDIIKTGPLTEDKDFYIYYKYTKNNNPTKNPDTGNEKNLIVLILLILSIAVIIYSNYQKYSKKKYLN